MVARIVRLLIGMLVLAVLAACSLGAPAPAPPQAQSPSATPTPRNTPRPTPKPAPTSAPAATPTGAEVAQLLQAALDKTKAAKTYRMTYTIVVTGETSLAPGGGMLPEGLFVTTEVNGADVHTTFGTNDGEVLSEFMTVGGVNYLRGESEEGDNGEENWYVMPQQELAPGEQAAVLPSSSNIDIFLGTDMVLSEFTPAGQMTLDSRPCTMYRTTGDMALNMFDGYGFPGTAALPADMDLDQQEMSFSVCDDGYVHQVLTALAGDDPQSPGQPFAMSMQLRISAFDTSLTIVPPENAQDLTDEIAGSDAGAPLTATVHNGGNVREQPNRQGRVLDQVNANETVELLAKNADSTWYQIINIRGVTGWVSASLLTVAPEVAAQVPDAPAATAPPSAPGTTTSGEWQVHQAGPVQLSLPAAWQILPLSAEDLAAIADTMEASNPIMARTIRQAVQSGQVRSMQFFAVDTIAVDGFSRNVNLLAVPNSPRSSIQEMLEAVGDALPQVLPGLEQVKSEVRTINGVEVGLLVYDVPINNDDGTTFTMRGYQFYILLGDTVEILTVSGEISAAFDALAEQIGASVRVAGAPGSGGTTSRVRNGGNLRSEPRVTPATVIGQVCPDDQVTILTTEQHGGARWHHVRVETTTQNCDPNRVSAGTEGWLNSTLVAP